MAAEELILSDNIEAELHPHVVLIANEPERFAKYASLLEKGGFPCQLLSSVPEDLLEKPREGTIFFVSFNLKSTNPAPIAKTIEQRHKMICIVFAELEGFDTAAKLSSARMSQTLQHPYTEKNFLMAVQTIVKKRGVLHEKNLRKQSVLDRRKNLAEVAPVEVDESDRVFKAAPPLVSTGPIIIQKGLRAEMHGEKQKGWRGAKFFAIEHAHNVKPRYLQSAPYVRERGDLIIGTVSKDGVAHLKHGSASSVHTSVTGKVGKADKSVFARSKKREGGEEEQLARSQTQAPPRILKVVKNGEAIEAGDQVDGQIRTRSAASETTGAESAAEKSQEFEPIESASTSKTNLVADLSVPTWMLVGVVGIGLVFCLFFLVQIIRH